MPATFAEDVDIYWARQLVLERLLEAERELPPGVTPELAPVSTGLGEIYQFTVERRSEAALATLGDGEALPDVRRTPTAESFRGLTGDDTRMDNQ